MVLKSAKEAETRLFEFREKQQKEASWIADRILEEETKVRQAKDEIAKAKESGSAEEYRSAKSKERDSLDNLELWKQKLQKIQTERAFSLDEYNKIIAEIRNEHMEQIKAATPKLKKSAEDMGSIAEDLVNAQEYGSKVIGMLTREVKPSEAFPPSVSLQEGLAIINWGFSAVRHQTYLNKYGYYGDKEKDRAELRALARLSYISTK